MFAMGTERGSVVANTVLRGLKEINCHLIASENITKPYGGSGKFNPPHPVVIITSPLP